jgi:hypothetical protein
MHRLSIVQALDLWSELEDARNGKAGYGGDVAEVYVYRFAPWSPSTIAFLSGPSSPVGFLSTEARDVLLDANESFRNLCLHYAKERNAIVEIQGFRRTEESDGFVPIDEVVRFPHMMQEGHRHHVRVRPNQEKRQP